MKRYQKVEDILSLAESFHKEMFAQLAEQEGKEKANLKATAERLKKT